MTAVGAVRCCDNVSIWARVGSGSFLSWERWQMSVVLIHHFGRGSGEIGATSKWTLWWTCCGGCRGRELSTPLWTHADPPCRSKREVFWRFEITQHGPQQFLLHDREANVVPQDSCVGRTGDPYRHRTPLPDIPSVRRTLAARAY